MKRHIVFIILAILLVIRVSAIELWNGFTTEMNREQIIAKARTVLSVNEFNEYTGWSFTPFTNPNSDRLNFNDFPKTELVLQFKSPLNQYRKDVSNISFYLSNGYLFAVVVSFQAFIDDFLPVARNQYGQPMRTFVETNRGQRNNAFDPPFQRTWHGWLLPDKGILIPGQRLYQNAPQSRDNGLLYIYDRQAVDKMYREREEAAARRRTETTSGIQF